MNRASVLACLTLAGCVSQARPAVRERTYAPGEYDPSSTMIGPGSLWPAQARGLFADFRATRVGDVVTIRIDETASAQGDASTATDRSSSRSLGIPGLFGLTSAISRAYPDIEPSELLRFASESTFDADGETRRESSVRAAIAVRVKRVLPNGDFFVEGTKVVAINDEELAIYVSGVIRPEDIEHDNSVRSSLLADAEVELRGQGTLSRNQEPGWLSRLLSAIDPF